MCQLFLFIWKYFFENVYLILFKEFQLNSIFNSVHFLSKYYISFISSTIEFLEITYFAFIKMYENVNKFKWLYELFNILKIFSDKWYIFLENVWSYDNLSDKAKYMIKIMFKTEYSLVLVRTKNLTDKYIYLICRRHINIFQR